MEHVVGGGGSQVASSTKLYNDEWWTPPFVFVRLGIHFDLDVCAPKGGVPWVPATDHLSREDDGLAQDWYGRVWCNPPYNTINTWLDRMADHGNGIALALGDSSTQRFGNHGRHASMVCFLSKRLRFIAPDWGQSKTAAFSNILIAYGDECADVLLASDLGLCMKPIVDAP